MAKLVVKQSDKAHGPLVSKWPATRKWLAVVKQSEVCDSGVAVACAWDTFDLLVFKVIWGSFNALASKWPVFNSKRQNGVKFRTLQ